MNKDGASIIERLGIHDTETRKHAIVDAALWLEANRDSSHFACIDQMISALEAIIVDKETEPALCGGAIWAFGKAPGEHVANKLISAVQQCGKLADEEVAYQAAIAFENAVDVFADLRSSPEFLRTLGDLRNVGTARILEILKRLIP